MPARELQSSGFQPSAAAKKTEGFSPRPFEVTLPGQEVASPTNPFPRRPHEVWMGESTDSAVGNQEQSDAPGVELDWSRISLYAEGQTPPEPPQWPRVQAKFANAHPDDPYDQEADRTAEQVSSEARADQEQGQPKQITPLVQRQAEVSHVDWFSHAPQRRSYGNPLQAKLTIGQPGDRYEQEADRVAEQVMSMAPPATPNIQRQEEAEESEEVQPKPLVETITPIVQRQEAAEDEEPIQAKCEACEQEETVQRTANGVEQAQPDLEQRLNASQGGGSPLSQEVRSFMEPRFGSDFSQVRVHTGSDAVQMNRELNAQAFTHKQDVYFGGGKVPGKDALTAHELTHVVQQNKGNFQIQQKESPDSSSIQCQTPAPAAGVNLPSPPPPGPNPQKGEHEDQQVGTWGVFAKTPLKTGKREVEDFSTKEAAIAYARGMGKAAAVFQEKDIFVVYPIIYSWWSGFSSFTYSGTRMFHGSNISDVMGVAGVLAFITEDGTAILPHQYGGEDDYKSWMEQQDALKPGENPFDAHKEAFGEGLGKITGPEKFLRQFELAMRDTVFGMLDRSQQEAKVKQQEMAGGLPDKDVKVIHKAAKDLEEVDKKLTDWKGKQSSLRTVVQDPVPFNQKFNDDAKRDLEEADKQVADLELQRRTILLDYPLLSQVNPAEFNKLNDADQAKMLGTASGQVLKDIEETRKNVASGDLNLWALDSIVKTTLAGLGITDAERQQWANEKAKREKRFDTAITIALGVLQIGLSIAATAVGGPAGVAFAVGALGVGVADAARTTDKYFTDKAAANTDIDKEKALIPADLTGEWAWVVLAWVGVGLSYVDAIKAVRAVKLGTQADEVIARLAKQHNLDEEVLRKALNKTLLGKAKPDPDALRKILLSALPEELAKKFDQLSVQVLDTEKWAAKFGKNSTAEAATIFSKGKNGELIPEVFFKETGNPLMMREEAVHIAQATDKEMASKLTKLAEATPDKWKALKAEEKLRLYRTKIEVEIDAQERLLKQFPGDTDYVEELQENLKNLKERQVEVDQALKNPEVKQGKLPDWFNSDHPPALFAKPRLPRTNGKWSGNPGNSLWYSDIPEVKKITGGEGIPFRSNYPVFSKWSRARVNIGEMSGFADDFAEADYLFARRNGWIKPNGEPNITEAVRYRQGSNPEGIQLTWHHHQGGKTMMLVPTDLHANVPHSGGASAARAK